MKKNAASHHHTDKDNLSDDVQSLLSATANTAENSVLEARRRLAAALDKGRETWSAVQDKAISGAKATDRAIRRHPYESMGIALGIGALLGFLLSRRNNSR